MTAISVYAVVAFLTGYLQQNFNLMMTIFGAGVALACLLSVPDWGWYNKHPLQWQPPQRKAVEQPAVPKGRRKKEAGWKNFWNLF